jgi:hypothetical protein
MFFWLIRQIVQNLLYSLLQSVPLLTHFVILLLVFEAVLIHRFAFLVEEAVAFYFISAGFTPTSSPAFAIRRNSMT